VLFELLGLIDCGLSKLWDGVVWREFGLCR